MNQKLKYFLSSLCLHQTLKRTILSEISVKIFFPSLYREIKDQNPSISEDFTKTFLKWPRDELETTWCQCWSALVSLQLQGGKTFCVSFCASLIAGSRRVFLFVDFVCLCRSVLFCESSDCDWMKYARCELFLRVKPFSLSLLMLFFRHLKITFDSEQTMLE